MRPAGAKAAKRHTGQLILQKKFPEMFLASFFWIILSRNGPQILRCECALEPSGRLSTRATNQSSQHVTPHNAIGHHLPLSVAAG